MMETLIQDLRYALRQLRRAPGFSLTAVLTLALGIGVTVTVAALVYRVLLAPLPYPEANRIVGISFHWPEEGASTSMTGTAGDFLLEHARSFSAIAYANELREANLSIAGEQAISIPVMGVSQGYFNVLGVQPALGRGFTAQQDRPGAQPAVVLSYGLWKSMFGGDARIVGRAIHLDGALVTVDGVMPNDFRAEAQRGGLTADAPAAWKTAQVGPGPGYRYNNYDMIARLRAGVSLEQARQELKALQVQLYRVDPFYNKMLSDTLHTPRTYQVWPYAVVVAGDIRPSLLVMTWAVFAVLLLTCLNLAGLNTARALGRAPEFALRAALGAAQSRMLRLALMETGLLALAGSLGAVFLSHSLLPFLLRNSPVQIPQLTSAMGGAGLAAVALVLGAVCALLCSAPYLAVASRRRMSDLGAQQRSAGAAPAQRRSAKLIVVTQVGLSLVLLSAAALLLGTFLKLRAQPLGFEPQKVVVFHISLKGERYATTQQTGAFVQQVVAHLQSTPGVTSAAAIVGLPLERGLYDSGWTAAHADQSQTVDLRTVSPGFLDTLGFHLLAGRGFSQSTDAAGPKPAILSAAAARRFWPGQSAVGRTLYVDERTNAYEIVGIVNDSPARQLGQPPELLVYTPISRQTDTITNIMNGYFPLSFVVREEAKLNAGRVAGAAVNAVDATIPVTGVTTMRAVIDNSVAAPRFFVQIAEAFAGFAVLLTGLGIFGLLSYQMKQRTREIGVRMALGATRGRILRGVLLAGAAMCTAGSIAGGVAAALLHPLLMRWIESDVAGIDPSQTQYLAGGATSIALALIVMAAACLTAAALPALKASKVDPMEALRTE